MNAVSTIWARIALLADGTRTAREIADAVPVPPSYVRHVCKRLGRRLKRGVQARRPAAPAPDAAGIRELRRKAIVAMLRAGYAVKEICAELKTSPNTVSTVRKCEGITAPPRETIALIHSRGARGKPQSPPVDEAFLYVCYECGRRFSSVPYNGNFATSPLSVVGGRILCGDCASEIATARKARAKKVLSAIAGRPENP